MEAATTFDEVVGEDPDARRAEMSRWERIREDTANALDHVWNWLLAALALCVLVAWIKIGWGFTSSVFLLWATIALVWRGPRLRVVSLLLVPVFVIGVLCLVDLFFGIGPFDEPTLWLPAVLAFVAAAVYLATGNLQVIGRAFQVIVIAWAGLSLLYIIAGAASHLWFGLFGMDGWPQLLAIVLLLLLVLVIVFAARRFLEAVEGWTRTDWTGFLVLVGTAASTWVVLSIFYETQGDSHRFMCPQSLSGPEAYQQNVDGSCTVPGDGIDWMVQLFYLVALGAAVWFIIDQSERILGPHHSTDHEDPYDPPTDTLEGGPPADMLEHEDD